jgi:hypothetical protein
MSDVTSPASAPPTRRRFRGLLPASLTAHRPPRWWQEVALVAIGYWLYGLGRNGVARDDSVALRHGRAVEHLQDALHLGIERSINRFVAAHEPLAQVMDYYYATLHFVVTAGVLIWAFRQRPRIYRAARTVLFSTTIAGLVGFYTFPLAPPRLLPQYGYVDTLVKFHTWGSLADPNIAEHSNQYAAMPSLHIGWALWCAITIYRCVDRRWIRCVALVYPVLTFMVIIGTANHFVLDAVGGVVAVGVGFTVQWLLSGHGTFVPAPATACDDDPVIRILDPTAEGLADNRDDPIANGPYLE